MSSKRVSPKGLARCLACGRHWRSFPWREGGRRGSRESRGKGSKGGEERKREQNEVKENKSSLEMVPRESLHYPNPISSPFFILKEEVHTPACPLWKHSPLEPTGLEGFVSFTVKSSEIQLLELCSWHFWALFIVSLWLRQKVQDLYPFTANLVSLRLWKDRRWIDMSRLLTRRVISRPKGSSY